MKDVYVKIVFTFTNNFHCILKTSVYKKWVTKNFCCDHEELCTVHSFSHHNKKEASLRDMSVHKQIAWESVLLIQ